MAQLFLKFTLFAVVVAAAGCHNQETEAGSVDRSDVASTGAAAQVEASRPADTSLSCQALEKEFMSLTKDPAIQSYVHTKESEAQKSEDAQSAQAQLAASLQSAQNPRAQQRAEAKQRMERQLQLMNDIMPQLTRAQRLSELAIEQKCAWAGMAPRSAPNRNDVGATQ